MLERHGLIIGPWQTTSSVDKASGSSRANPLAVRSRRIVEAQTEQPLGWVHERPPPGWFVVSWFTRPIWDVVETEDESLLLSVHGKWGLIKPWEVFDADDQLLCLVHQRSLFDNAGQYRARLTPTENTTTMQFLTREDTVLARVRCLAEGLELTFADIVRPDPYAKMALLGGTLALEG